MTFLLEVRKGRVKKLGNMRILHVVDTCMIVYYYSYA